VDVPRRATLDVSRTDSHEPVTLRQISVRGLVVEGPVALAPDSACDVRLCVEGFRPLTLEGHVVYSRAGLALDADARVRFASAVAIDRLTAEDAEVLAAIVTSLGELVDERGTT
jgi:hypothetical protein